MSSCIRNLLLVASALALLLPSLPTRADEHSTPFDEILVSEEILLSLTPVLRDLSTDVLNLSLPDLAGRSLFANQVEYTDLAPERSPTPATDLASVSVQSLQWPIVEREKIAVAADLRLWRPLLERIDYFEHAKFYFERGNTIDGGSWEADLAFTAAARTTGGQLLAVKARMSTYWSRGSGSVSEEGSSEPVWRIERWRLKSMKTHETPDPLFREALDQALPHEGVLRQARRSVQEELVIEWGKDLLADGGSFEPPHVLFDISSLYQKPGLSVVDIDNDGFDDLYVMPTWGDNLLLRNRGDGTFEEIAEFVGLDLTDNCSSAVFADFDNDGDADAFIGRTFRPSLFLVNEDGFFVNRSHDLVSTALPYFVTSISAADFNRDGLLDVYFSTYAHDDSRDRLQHVLKLLPAYQAREMMRRRQEGHRFHDHAGPPNMLLVNRGDGRFDVAAPQSEQLAVWHNTFQSTWSDYDNDGDPDLYVANDFAPNNLFRNDGGNGGFADVTDSTGTADIGFGMGVSWGDYDRDGRHDLYVCNMFSKAGSRIMAQIPELDPRITALAGGNSLFHNRGTAGFEKVSGTQPPSMLVEKSGWAWGGQFADFDNDSFLDIYSLAGYYTAPEEIAVPAADL